MPDTGESTASRPSVPWLAAGAALCAFPWPLLDPRLARYHIEFGLALGIAMALSGRVSPGLSARRASALVVQGCVVLLGLRMDLGEVARAGASGALFAAATIVGVFVLGWVLGRVLRTDGRMSALLSSGTAICGGSAIAAVSSVIGAGSTQVSVATATVFILNGAALYLFPVIGARLGMSPEDFGTWAGVAIHDVSSVVGAAASYRGDAAAAALATQTATVVKLSRVIWIVPICIAAAWWARRGAAEEHRASVPIPWFIVLFLLASAARTAWPAALAPAESVVMLISRCGMAMALYLIGAGLSRSALASVGWRPLVQGVVMWVALSAAALAVVRR